LLLFCERASGTRTVAALAPVQRALDTGFTPSAPAVQPGHARLAISARVQRQWGRTLFGLSFFVLAVEADDGRR
jgi:hypothetical protein